MTVREVLTEWAAVSGLLGESREARSQPQVRQDQGGPGRKIFCWQKIFEKKVKILAMFD